MQMSKQSKFSLTAPRNLTRIALLAAMSAVLSYLELPPFIPQASFLQLHFAAVPAAIAALIGGFPAMICVQFVSNLIHCLVSHTFGIGELSNFVLGIALVWPYTIRHKIKLPHAKQAVVLGLMSTVSLVVVGWLSNYFFLLPTYSIAMNVPVEVLRATLPFITLFNLVKGIVISMIVALLPAKFLDWMGKQY